MRAFAVGGLLGYFLEEIGPLVYNQAVADVQERLQARIAELDIGKPRGRIHVLAQVRPGPEGQVSGITATSALKMTKQ